MKWKTATTNYVQSDFIPQYEFPGVSAALPGFDPFFFSMRGLSVKQKKEDIIGKLNVLADAYEEWD
ncbi:Helicase conserved [human gut metagenome]|uniref:Helicase conserved n=1 Tax=human gut metagenome TaxID=408170 RepID=K1SJX9_9ZZZZ